MSRPQHHKVALSSAALGIGAVLALSGCSAGQTTQTSSQVAAVNGASTGADEITVRDAEFSFPEQQPYYRAGSSAPIELVLANDGDTSDRLVRVTSPYAASAEIGGFTTLAPRTALHAYGESRPESAPEDYREIQITLRDLKQEIGPGVTIPVTFVFEKAGPMTAQIPIAASPDERSEHGSSSNR